MSKSTGSTRKEDLMKKSIISILSAFTGAAIGAGVVKKTIGETVNESKAMSNKHLALFLLMNQWVKVKQERKNVADYLKKEGYNKIAVYGMSYVGETLLNELKNTEVDVAYGIDKNAARIYSDVDVYSVEDDLKQVDEVIVTAITFYDEVVKVLQKKLDCPIMSIEDILYEI